jgi:hypothetical protein
MKRSLYIACGCLAVLLILFFSIDPNKVPSFILVFPFILLFVILLSAISLLLRHFHIEGKKNIKIAALCASLPILLLVLQSIGQLTVRDVLTVALLFMLSFFYISRTTVSS